ncbi:hypothetical protein DL766_004480 [Monosporascus sp. MC13-8B]|uniref:DUF2428 domain-containing protein n=1 Tax=Monosporascus cannonballus TaxID=155416 RepID=A0ABY0H0X4_9PEZI|nr:hypothetical protein DL762_007175 [Monosporascus cannonballus]RYO86143.1 hypothetical protein DL763_006836 [Monosporascus cannonballus]RYP31172.1 hypothetical protein DL766_004480 [Monosporascus sp. MC13-8B]
MNLQEDGEMILDIEDTSFNPRHAVAWVEKQSPASQPVHVENIFQELVRSASKPKQLSGNACVKLCGFVEQCSKSSSTLLRAFALSEDTAARLFDFFVEWNEQDSHRSMKLILDFLAYSISKNPTPETGLAIKTRILRDTVTIITRQSSKPSVKSAITYLDYIILKNLVYPSDVLEIYRRVHELPSHQEVTWDEFISKLFNWLELHNSLTGSENTGWDVNSMLWLAMLEVGKKVGVVDEPGTKAGAVAQLSVDTLETVLGHESVDARSAAVSILIASPSTTKPYTKEALELLRKHLPSFYADTDPKFRYDVLGHSRSMIKRIQGSLEALRRDYGRAARKLDKANGEKGSAHEPPESIDSSEASKQANRQEVVVKGLHTALDQHQRFVCWYMDFLKNELVPTASYQRHITALKAMHFVLKSTLSRQVEDLQGRDHRDTFTDSTWLRCVLDLVLDPFDDVREAAASLIMLLAQDKPGLPETPIAGLRRPVVEELRAFCRRAEELARKTARADHADGVARSYEVLWRWTADAKGQLRIIEIIVSDLEEKLGAAERDLATAVLKAPVHGSFASLRYLWGSLSVKKYTEDYLSHLESLQDRAIACCDRIWQAVRHILCDDSPEGHLPEELEEVEGLDTKGLLSYSFRAIHESSNLMKTIGNNARNERAKGLLTLSRDSFERIGRLTFDELSNLRHRGAFTTVTQTFSSCCQLVKYFPAPTTEQASVLGEWYKGALNCIYTQASTTRRSAGIPALIVGILSANADYPSFDTIMRQLREIAERPARIAETDGSNLPQVHALNCLKDVFKSSALSKRAEAYLTDCLELAANSLKSEVWAIRNCGLLLLRSLIDCLLGTNESKTAMEAGWDGRTTKVSYHKFPALPAVLVNLLEMGQQSSGVLIGSQMVESVFPALDIIRRAGPPEAFRDKLFDIIAWYLGSHIWHVREIAARTLCSFLLRPDWIGPVESLIADSKGSANKLHGALLTLKFLLERLLEVMPSLLIGRLTLFPDVERKTRLKTNMHLVEYSDSLRGLLEAIPDMSGCLDSCLEARAVYIEIASFVAELDPRDHALGNNTTTSRPAVPSPDQTSSEEHPTYATIPFRPDPSSALLTSSLAVAATKELLRNARIGELERNLQSALKDDVNIACVMLETLAEAAPPRGEGAGCALVHVYMGVCSATEAPEPRTLALGCLAVLLDAFLARPGREETLRGLPAQETFHEFWTELHRKPLNPSLSDAVVRLSGPLLAVFVRRAGAPPDEGLLRWLRSWGAMVSDAGSDDRIFDTRMAAVTALKSFSEAVPPPADVGANPDVGRAHLPWLLALYDALNDDDEEVRAAAAQAAAPVLGGRPTASVEAAARLLAWLRGRYGSDAEFRAHAAGRVIGHAARVPGAEGEGAAWVPAERQLRAAMRFDGALFVVEEQNQYVDEVREARRWRDVLLFPPSSLANSDPGLRALAAWTLAGLRTLTRLLESGGVGDEADADARKTRRDGDGGDDDGGGDGPLAWASKPQVFAICARILISGAALLSPSPAPSSSSDDDGKIKTATATTATEGDVDAEGLRGEIGEALRAFRDAGRAAGVHGLLLGMCATAADGDRQS